MTCLAARLSSVCGALLIVAAACSAGHSGTGAAPPRPTAFPAFPGPGDCDLSGGGGGVPGVGDTGPSPNGPTKTVPAGVDVGPTGSGLGSGNPYTVAGARPVPDQHMPATTIGASPSQQVVASPPNPDVGTPANLAPGQTVPPAAPATIHEQGLNRAHGPFALARR